MSTFVELTVDQATTPDVELTITQDGMPLDLSTVDVLEVFVKPHRSTDDDDTAVEKLTVGDGIVVTDGPGGVCVATIPAAALLTAGVRWWRVDATISGKRRTAMYGPLKVHDT